MALGRIAPDLLDELRKGGMNAGQAQALTLTADHEKPASRRGGSAGGGWNADVQIRRLLTETATGFNNPLMRLVGRDAYEGAGGGVRVDLCSARRTGRASPRTRRWSAGWRRGGWTPRPRA